MKWGLLLIIFIAFFPFSLAAEIVYDVGEKEVYTEIDYHSSEFPLIELPNDAIIIENVKGEKITFFSKSLLEKSRKGNFFITKNKIHRGSNITVILPKGASISNDKFLFPSNYKLETNGKNIIITFQNSPADEILVAYQDEKNFNFLLFFIIISSAILLFFYEKHSKKNKKYTQNLYKDEKKIMDYLVKKKDCWTKELIKDLKISKVRLSRKLRSLEQRGLIEKEPFGNENRIKLKK